MEFVRKLERGARRRMMLCIGALAGFVVLFYFVAPPEDRVFYMGLFAFGFSFFLLLNYVEWAKYKAVREEMEAFEAAQARFIRVYLPPHPHPLQLSSHKIVRQVNGKAPARGLDGKGYFVYLPVEEARTVTITLDNRTALLFTRRPIYQQKQPVTLEFTSGDMGGDISLQMLL